MDKVLAFLEKYVEWIAIAIGGLIFMFAVWVYWIAPDVSAEVGGRRFSPGGVDKAVLSGPGESLKVAVNDPRPGNIPVPPDLAEEFIKDLELRVYTPAPIQFAAAYSGPAPIAAPDGSLPDNFLVDTAPTPPPARIVKLASGRSFAGVDDGGQVSEVDLAEVRVDFSISPDAIADAFRRVSLPSMHQNTSVLRVTLMRQRLLPDGTWGEDKEVPLLSNNPLAAQYPMPPADAPVETKQAYAAFAEQNSQWVLQPPFHEVRAGDDPMDLKVVVEVPEGGEAQPASGDPGDGAATQESGGQSQTNFNFQDREQDERGGAAGAAPPAQTPPPVQRPPAQPNRPQPGDAEPQPAAPLPPGTFNAAELAAPITGWAWDTDAVPGETYRYKIVYSLKNPMFGTRGVAENRELESLLVLPSAPASEWSPPITVEPLFYSFMTEGGTLTSATFTVFRWQNGGWQAEKFKVTPGDAIGVTTEGGIDYRTGQTLVDVRVDPTNRETFALLVDEQGRFSRRTIRDAADPRLKQLQDLLKTPPDDGVARR